MLAGDRLALPAGEVLVSVVRRGCALAVDTFVAGFPFLVAAVYLYARNCGASSTDRLLLSVGGAVFAVGYHTISVARWGRTLGKAMFRCRVVRADSGAPAGWSQAAIRALVIAVVSAVPVIGILAVVAVYALASRDPHLQGLHDRAAGTLVVLD